MKQLRKMLSLALALTMCMAMAVSASASDQPDPEENRWTVDSNGDQVYIVGDEVDTTPLEIPRQTFATRGRSLLFTMNLRAMYEDIHTTGSKSFTKASLSNSYVRASGRIDNSGYGYVTIGLCEYDDGFYAPAWTLRDVDCGTSFVESWPKSSLSSNFYYYGYAQSPYSNVTTHYSGSVDYYDSSEN